MFTIVRSFVLQGQGALVQLDWLLHHAIELIVTVPLEGRAPLIATGYRRKNLFGGCRQNNENTNGALAHLLCCAEACACVPPGQLGRAIPTCPPLLATRPTHTLFFYTACQSMGRLHARSRGYNNGLGSIAVIDLETFSLGVGLKTNLSNGLQTLGRAFVL